LRIDTGVKNHVFPNLKSANLRVRVVDPNQGRAAYAIRLTVKDTAFTKRLEKPLVSQCPWKPNKDSEMELALGLKEAGAAYEVIADLLADGKIVDQEKLKIGVKEDSTPVKVTIDQPTLATTFGEGKVVLTNGEAGQWYATDNAKTELPFAEYYKENIADWQRLHISIVRLECGAPELLPLPGLINLRTVEERVYLLREAGMPYMFAISIGCFHYAPAWMDFGMQEDMSGLPYVGWDSWDWAYFLSPAAPAYVEGLQTMIQALYARYGNDRLFRGWAHQTDILFAEHGNRRVDCSPDMQRGFVRWLREQKGVATITELNTRYGTQLTDWGKVDTPLPPARYYGLYSGAPDATEHQSYRDYWAYRVWAIKHLQNDGMVRFARALGDSRPFGFFSYSFGQDEENYLPDLIKLGCFTTLGTEGVPSHNFIRNKVLMPIYGGHAYVAEYQALLPGYKDMEERDVDNIFATVMLAGGRNININMFRVGPYSQTIPGAPKASIILRGLERQRLWMEALPAFARSEIYPWEVACYNFGESGGSELAQYLWPRYPNHLLKGFMPDTAFSEQKLIFIPKVDGSVHNADFTPEMRAKSVNYVKGGGRLVLVSPDSARYTRDNRAQQFALLTELGWRDHFALLPAKKGLVEATPVARGLFKTTKKLTLAGPLPGRMHLPVGATVEARFQSGQPAVARWPVGKGEVLLFIRELELGKQRSRAFVDDLFAWAGVARRVTAPCWFSYAHDGDIRYLMLYVEGKPKPARTLTVKVHHLPVGRYRVRNIGPDKLELGVKRAEDWRGGVQIPLNNGMLVLRFTPIREEGNSLHLNCFLA